MDPRITEILVCPLCKGSLFWDAEKKEFFCRVDMKAYAVREGIPSMAPSEARDLTEEELAGKGTLK